MKIAVIVALSVFAVADTFVMWCLCRASGIYEQQEQALEVHRAQLKTKTQKNYKKS